MRPAVRSIFVGVALSTLGLGAIAQTTASLTAPPNNAIYELPVTITLKAGATATVPATITRVAFYANGSLIGTDTTKAYAFAWVNPTPGTYTLTAIAYDSAGGETTSAPRITTVNAANQPPTASLTAPPNNSNYALPATVALKATATPPETNDTVAKVDFFANGALIGTDTSKAYTITWTPAAGSYTLTAVATDGQGAQTTSNARAISVAANQPPTVSLSAPANNARFAPPATITLKANATPPEDNDTVARVDFFANGTLIGSDTSKAYTFTWSTPSPGIYALTAVATDGQGAQTTSAARTITVDAANLPPTVSLTAPPNNSVFSTPGTITINANASPPEANDTVARVDFFANGNLIGSDTSKAYSFTWTNPAAGTYTLTAVATDGQGAQTTSSARTITVSTAANVPPTVSLTSPAGGATFTAPATIPLAATAADSDGTVVKVDFFQGATLIGTSTSAPYAFSWTNVAQGAYVLTAVATDDGGATTTSNAVNITVNAGVAHLYYIVPDHLNAPRMIADGTGTTVWRWDQGEPFGNDVPNNNPSGAGAFDFPLRFPGQYFDRETNLTYNVMRDYDTGTGRYVEADPVGTVLFRNMAFSNLGNLGLSEIELASLLYRRQPQYNHLYAYVASNAVNFIDPFGLEAVSVCSKVWHPHTFICVGGNCSGKYPSGNPLYSPGKILDDSPNQPSASCSPVPNNGCDENSFSQCVTKRISKRGPTGDYYNYMVGNCGDWVEDVITQCRNECTKK
jgi:RHS repeat-associated protein